MWGSLTLQEATLLRTDPGLVLLRPVLIPFERGALVTDLPGTVTHLNTATLGSQLPPKLCVTKCLAPNRRCIVACTDSTVALHGRGRHSQHFQTPVSSFLSPASSTGGGYESVYRGRAEHLQGDLEEIRKSCKSLRKATGKHCLAPWMFLPHMISLRYNVILRTLHMLRSKGPLLALEDT